MQRPSAGPTIRQAVILAGGCATSRSEPTAAAPKALLQCGDRPFLAWQLRELCRFGVEEVVLLTGPFAQAVEAALPAISASLPRPLRITCDGEFAERFLLCRGESWLDFNLGRLLADAARDPDDVACRMVLHRLDDASGYRVAETDGDRVSGFSEPPEAGQSGLIDAGIYVLNRRAPEAAPPACSIADDILPQLAGRGALRGTLADGNFIDIGRPADLVRAQTELPGRLRRRGLFLDRDGVINVDHGWVGTRERFDFMPGAVSAIRAASDAGWHVFIVTNQSGIARGLFDEAQFAALSAWMIEVIRAGGGTIDDLRYCPTHPDAPLTSCRRASDWRKPGPGMLLDLLSCWQLDPARCLLIGDQSTDLAAAAAAGVPGHLFADQNLAGFVLPLLAACQRA